MPNLLPPLRLTLENFLTVFGEFKVSFSSSSKGMSSYLSKLPSRVNSGLVVDVNIQGVVDLGQFTVAELLHLYRKELCNGSVYLVDFKNPSVLIATTKQGGKFAKQPKLSSVERWKWLSEHVSTYASGKAYDGKNLSLKVSGLLSFTVTHGDSTVYSGFEMGTAIDAYNNLL